MNRDGVLGAMRDTVAWAEKRGLQGEPDDPCGLPHLKDMLRQMEQPDFGFAKMNRWLGYAQGVSVKAEVAGLDDVKEISKRYADDRDTVDRDWLFLLLGYLEGTAMRIRIMNVSNADDEIEEFATEVKAMAKDLRRYILPEPDKHE